MVAAPNVEEEKISTPLGKRKALTTLNSEQDQKTFSRLRKRLRTEPEKEKKGDSKSASESKTAGDLLQEEAAAGGYKASRKAEIIANAIVALGWKLWTQGSAFEDTAISRETRAYRRWQGLRVRRKENGGNARSLIF